MRSSLPFPPTTVFSLSVIVFAFLALSGNLRSQQSNLQWVISNNLGTHNYTAFATFGNDRVFIGTSNVVYIITNNGASWDMRWIHGGGPTTSICFFRNGNGLLAHGLHTQWIEKTFDTGRTWRTADAWSHALPCAASMYRHHSVVAMHPSGIVFVGSDINYALRSSDSGKTWDCLTIGKKPWVTPVLFAAQSGAVYCGSDTGCYVSHDIGNTWLPIGPDTLVPHAFYEAPDSAFYIVTRTQGVWRTRDTGKTWQTFIFNPNDTMHTIVVSTTGLLYAGGSNGVYCSSDSGTTWLPANSGLTNTYINVLGIDQQGYLWAGTKNGLFRSTNTVPVTLFSFTAQAEGMNAVLSWRSAQERNCYRYFIERSGDREAWHEVGFTPCNNTSEESEYTFTDALSVSGLYRYRLRQTDMDGSVTYSQSAEVFVGDASARTASMLVYPNPVSKQNGSTVTLAFTGSEAKQSSVAVYDMLGRVRKRETAWGTGTLLLHIHALEPGTYMLVLYRGGLRSVGRVTIIE